ncbi:MAG: hypothetical protein OXC99_02700 [Chloroflexi bacterium]|nr:hypothetical protein [Chloroflexota bacterium]
MACWRLTQDAPLEQRHKTLMNEPRSSGEEGESAFLLAGKDHRVWVFCTVVFNASVGGMVALPPLDVFTQPHETACLATPATGRAPLAAPRATPRA